MKQADINEFKKFVQDALIRMYHMTETEAADAVCKSYLSKALEDDNDYVDHDTIEEWAEFIHKEISISNNLLVV